ncbi:MAG: cupredoxin domain-containing protein, partial [Halobacteriaceae archaeon]
TSKDVTHGFGIPALEVNKRLPPGKTVTVEFTADQTGTFRFLCTVVCGRGHGSMTGKLIVK